MKQEIQCVDVGSVTRDGNKERSGGRPLDSGRQEIQLDLGHGLAGVVVIAARACAPPTFHILAPQQRARA
jgi:hypothetical protein